LLYSEVAQDCKP